MALSKPAYSSVRKFSEPGLTGSEQAALVVDGDLHTDCVAMQFLDSGTKWWKVDLGSLNYVSYARIYNTLSSESMTTNLQKFFSD